MAVATFFTILAGIIAVVGLAVFLFGIPPELKRKIEIAALKSMGENKLSYITKGTYTAMDVAAHVHQVTDNFQARLTRFLHPTKPTLSSSRKASATSLVA